MRNVRFVVRYDGGAFDGFQRQPGRRTVQQTLEDAMTSVTRTPARTNPSGRTDAGVHARGQVVNVYLATELTPHTLVRGVNANLPAEIAVSGCDVVGESFCANKDALTKRYRYTVSDERVADPFARHFAYHGKRPMSVEQMRLGASHLLGRRDFRSFETNYPNRLSSVRTITAAEVFRTESGLVAIEVEANGFLYNMVRAIAGTLIRVGRGDWAPDAVAEIVAAKDRRRAGPNAPAHGLCLMSVTYPERYMPLPVFVGPPMMVEDRA